jgi:hypothetical protein
MDAFLPLRNSKPALVINTNIAQRQQSIQQLLPIILKVVRQTDGRDKLLKGARIPS